MSDEVYTEEDILTKVKPNGFTISAELKLHGEKFTVWHSYSLPEDISFINARRSRIYYFIQANIEILKEAYLVKVITEEEYKSASEPYLNQLKNFKS